MKFQALTGLRGLCALIVAMSHLSVSSWIVQSRFVENSYLLVDFFFVLSGFVIAYAYLDRLSGGVSFVAFMMRRFGRVYPLHFAILLAMVALELVRFTAYRFGMGMEQLPFTGATSLPTLVSNLLLVQSIGIHDQTSWNYNGWSISVEFYTYVVFAVIAACTVALTQRLRRTLFIGLMAAAACIPILLSKTGMYVTSDYGLYRCIYGFMAGVLTLLAYRAAQAPIAPSEPALLSKRLSAGVAEIMCLLMVVAFVMLAGFGTLSFAAPIVFAACVFVFADEAGPISALLVSPVMRYLGDRSYSIYMIHTFIGADLIHRAVSGLGKLQHVSLLVPYVSGAGEATMLMDFGSPIVGDVMLLGYLGITILVSHHTYALIEEPWRKRFNALATRFEAAYSSPAKARLARDGSAAQAASPTRRDEPLPADGRAAGGEAHR